MSFARSSDHLGEPHVISSREGHARKLRHKGTTLELYTYFFIFFKNTSLLEIVLFGKTYIIAWQLMAIAKDQSTHSESSIFQVCSSWKIYLMHDLTCQISNKDGDQNTDPPCDQLVYNIGTCHYDLRHLILIFLEEIQHSQTQLVWSNLEYENCFDFHILSHADSY